MHSLIKSLHALTALITVSGFALRGYWMVTDNPMLKAKVTRILPHVIDTLFLLSGIVLLVNLGGSPLTQPWMLFKIAGLFAYIGFGMVALRFGKTRGIRATAFVVALAVFAYTYGVALSKSPLSWFGKLFAA